MKQITKDMIIADVLEIDPNVAPFFFAIGMHCLGCSAARGETVEEALMRETREELGLTGVTTTFLLQYVFESEREKELVHVFRASYDGEVCPSDELDGGRFWTMDELKEHSDLFYSFFNGEGPLAASPSRWRWLWETRAASSPVM